MNRVAYVVCSLVALAAVAACSGSASIDDPQTGDDQEAVSAGVLDRAAYAGSYEDRNQVLQDLGSLELNVDGTYGAHVLASVVGDGTLCIVAPCNVVESGTWLVSHSKDGTDRLRLKPVGRPLRTYRATRLAESGALFLERKQSAQALQLVAIPFTGPKCALVRCAASTPHCFEQPSGAVACLGETIPFGAPKCPTIRCAAGTHCVERGANTTCVK